MRSLRICAGLPEPSLLANAKSAKSHVLYWSNIQHELKLNILFEEALSKRFCMRNQNFDSYRILQTESLISSPVAHYVDSPIAGRDIDPNPAPYIRGD